MFLVHNKSGQLQHNSKFVEAGGLGWEGECAKHLGVILWNITEMAFMFTVSCKWEVRVSLG